jgi:hypothetical protein
MSYNGSSQSNKTSRLTNIASVKHIKKIHVTTKLLHEHESLNLQSNITGAHAYHHSIS